MTRDHVVPVGMMGALFGLALLLIVAGHRSPFEHHTAGRETSPELAERLSRIHEAVTGRLLSDTAARVISQQSGPASIVERFAYRVMFEFEPATIVAGVLLGEGGFKRGQQWVRGWERAADIVFGAKTETLTDAEIALYCYWVVSGQESWSPDDIMASRQMLLDRLRKRRAITEESFRALKAQPLVLRPTPIPIN